MKIWQNLLLMLEMHETDANMIMDGKRLLYYNMKELRC